MNSINNDISRLDKGGTETSPLQPTIGVKFANRTVLLKSFLDQRKIQYDENELEMTPLGLGKVLKEN